MNESSRLIDVQLSRHRPLSVYICINVSFINLLQVNKFNCMLHFKYQKKTCSFWSAMRTPWFSSWGSLFWWYSWSGANIRLRSSDLQLTKSRRWRDSLNGNLSTLESCLTLQIPFSCYYPFWDHIGVHRVERVWVRQEMGAWVLNHSLCPLVPPWSSLHRKWTEGSLYWRAQRWTYSLSCVYLMYWKTKCCLLLICYSLPLNSHILGNGCVQYLSWWLTQSSAMQGLMVPAC